MAIYDPKRPVYQPRPPTGNQTRTTNPSRGTEAVQESYDQITQTGKGKPKADKTPKPEKGKGGGKTKSQRRRLILDAGPSAPVDRDADFASATLYLPFTTDLQDHSNVGATMTVNGGPALSATTPKFGSNSVYSAGSLGHQVDNIVSPVDAGNYNTGTGDFTIMGWWRFDSTSITDPFPIMAGSGGNYASAGTWSLQLYKATGTVSFFNDGSNNPNVSGFTNDTWHHIAVIRSAGSIKVYLDGTAGTPQAKATNIGYLDDKVEILSGLSGASDNGDWGGNCQDFVFMPGVAWKTGNFTAPTVPFGGTGS